MPKKSQKGPLCRPVTEKTSFCKFESVVGIDERGQRVLPKELREKADIRAGDKFAVISWDEGGRTGCLYLIKTDHLSERLKDFLGPMMEEMAG